MSHIPYIGILHKIECLFCISVLLKNPLTDNIKRAKILIRKDKSKMSEKGRNFSLVFGVSFLFYLRRFIMNETNRPTTAPQMLTIRQVAKTGLLSEHALRLLAKQNKLPAIQIGTKLLVNYSKLCEQLQNL